MLKKSVLERFVLLRIIILAVLLVLLFALGACAGGTGDNAGSGQVGGSGKAEGPAEDGLASDGSGWSGQSERPEADGLAPDESGGPGEAGEDGQASGLPGDTEDSGGVAGNSGSDYGYGQIASFSTTDLDGGAVTEAIFKEKPVAFINYWATWCGPCRSELPDFPGMHEKYKEQVTFVTIVDDGKGNDNANALADEYLKGYINILPTEELVGPIQSGYVPTSVIVDAGGFLVIDKIVGAVGDYSGYIDLALAIVAGNN